MEEEEEEEEEEEGLFRRRTRRNVYSRRMRRMWGRTGLFKANVVD